MLRWFIMALAFVQGGWMAFDGVRALVVGDYVTPKSGPRAGQLGPWAHVIAGVGLDPRSTAMKLVFVGYGVAWLAMLAAFQQDARWAWWGLLLLGIGSAWYVPVGTLF